MQKSDKSQKATAARRKVQASTARNRKTVAKKKAEAAKKVVKDAPEVVLPKSAEKASAEKAPEVVLPGAKKEDKTQGTATEKTAAKAEKKIEKSPKITKFNIEVIDEPKEEPKLEKAIEKAKKIISVVEVEDSEEEEVAEEATHDITEVEIATDDDCVEDQSACESSDTTEVNASVKASSEKKPEPEVQEVAVAMPTANLGRVYDRMRSRTETSAEPAKQSAKEVKKQEIDKALANAAKRTEKQIREKPHREHVRMDWKRMVLALSCTAAAVAAIVYFVNLNAPDISLRVAAMQTGIEASYPSYVPRDYALSDISSENGKVVLNFKNAAAGTAFTVIEEKSSWDSDALLTNYVRKTFGDDYTTIKEQGLTIYVANSNAAWVNGGVVYKIQAGAGTLTKKQITTIATSL